PTRIRGLGGGDRTRRNSRRLIARGVFDELSSGRGGRAGVVGRRRLRVGQYVLACSYSGPFAVPLLREYPLKRAARHDYRRHGSSRAATPRAFLVDHLRLGSSPSRAVTPEISIRNCRYGYRNAT